MNKIKKRFGGLQKRLLLTIVIAACLFSLVAVGFAYKIGEERAIANSEGLLADLAQAVEKTVAIGTFANDPVLIKEVVDGLARNSMVATAQVVLLNNEVLVQNTKSLVLSDNLFDASSAIFVERRLFSPFDENEQIGTLRILADENYVAASAKQESATLAAIMICQVGLIAVLLYAVVAILISRPISVLAGQLEALPPGTSVRLETPSLNKKDEIGTLISVTNALLDANATALNRERGLRSEIELMEAQYRQIFDSSSAGIFVLNEKGSLINSNPTVSKVLGISMEKLQALSHDSFIDKVFGQPEQVRAMIEQSSNTKETVSGDLELIQKGDTRRWVHCLISVHDGASGKKNLIQKATTEGVMYDITERKSAESAVRYQAEHDALTGLKNRSASHTIIEDLLSECDANSSSLAILCIDLDGFKAINDLHGHDAGDEVLKVCAQRMQIAVRRSTNLVGRLGGDEFIVVLRDIRPDDIALDRIARDLLTSICEPITIGELQVKVGASIGIACSPLNGNELDYLITMADKSMYEVKRTGKNNYALAIPR